MKFFKQHKTIDAVLACLTAVTVIISLTVGCSYEKNNSSEEHVAENHFSKTYSDNFIVDADIPASYNDKANILTAKTMQFDDEDILSVLFKGRNPEKSTENGIIFYTDTKSAKEDPTYDYAVLRINSDSSEFNFSCLELLYPEFAAYFFKTDYEHSADMIEYSEAFKKDNLSFMSKEDALKAVSTELKKLNIDMPDNAEIYALDCESLQSYWDANSSKLEMYTINPNEIKTFTQDNEFYAVCFRCAFDGVPITSDDYVIAENDTYVTGSNVKVFYSKSGIIGMIWYGLYDLQDAAESPDSLIPVQEAFDKAFEAANAQDNVKEIIVKEARFEYMIIPDSQSADEFNLVPSWSLISSAKFGSSSEEINMMIHVNAITGEVVNRL